jgi:hypothetical protein
MYSTIKKERPAVFRALLLYLTVYYFAGGAVRTSS